jgi:hypothetical protein
MSSHNAEATEKKPLEFNEAVELALTNKKVKVKCLECGMIGLAGFLLHPAPVVSPTVVAGQVILSAALICGKCGGTKFYNLNVLGLRVEMEQKRIVTPGQVQQQTSGLVIP